MAEEVRTFGDILDEIIDLAKLQNTDDVRSALKRKVNVVYQELCFEEPYRWTGVTQSLLLKAKYTDGTVSIDPGSDRVVGTNTAWTENAHLFSKIKLPGADSPYKIIRVNEVSQELTLDAPWTKDFIILGSYAIYKDEYGLFPDAQGLRTFTIPGIAINRQPMPCGPIEMDEARARFAFRSGLPMRYTINGNAHYHAVTWADFKIDFDYWEDAFTVQPRNKKLIIWPALIDHDRVCSVRFTKNVDSLDADADEPLIPFENRSVLIYGTLLKNFLKNRDPQMASLWKREYVELKTKMAADIETTDDELVMCLDKRDFSWRSEYGYEYNTPPWER